MLLLLQCRCPVDSYVFPELDRGRSGDSLEARFNAFKIPESNFLVFEATVRTCREGCQPAYCPSGSGRSEPSFGRRKRDINGTLYLESNNTLIDNEDDDSNYTTTVTFPDSAPTKDIEEKESEPPEYVREMIEVFRNNPQKIRTLIFLFCFKVFESREELQQEARRALPVEETVCLTNSEYKGLISTVLVLAAILITISLIVGLAYRKYWLVMRKNVLADRASTPISTSYPTTRSSGISGLTGISIFGSNFQKPLFGRARSNFPGIPKDDLECPVAAPGGIFEDPSEPIYTDPSLFERSRSLRSISVSQKRRHSPQNM